MTAQTNRSADPWLVELLVITGADLSGGDRRGLSRDVARGLRRRPRTGVYVDRAEFDELGAEAQHLVRMRALAASSAEPVVFSHWSAAVLHGLPVLAGRLAGIHVTIPRESERHRIGVAHHVFPLVDGEVVERHGLRVTGVGRTVVDVAGAAALEESVMAADRALLRGLPRAVLEAAIDLAGPRRAERRIAAAIAFAHPGAESPAESRTRVTSYRLGAEVPELQREFRLSDGGLAFTDTWFPHADAVLEVDGDRKYLDPAMAPEGAGRAVLKEKRREDDIRAQVRAFGRIGWAQSGSTARLRPTLERLGVHPTSPRTPFAAYCAAAQAARPRR